jgi:hypothetical protein
MKTELVLFGCHFKMALRTHRRRFVVLFYGVFGALLLMSWLRGSHTGGGFWTIEFTLLVGPVLGGYFGRISTLTGGAGLVEPFKAQERLKYPDSASILRPSSLLDPVVDDDPELRTDERALRRRDYAHYVAHGFLGTLISIGFILEFGTHSMLGPEIESIGLSSGSVNHIVYGLLQIGYVSSMTLPQAVLLWTEPNLEKDAS